MRQSLKAKRVSYVKSNITEEYSEQTRVREMEEYKKLVSSEMGILENQLKEYNNYMDERDDLYDERNKLKDNLSKEIK